MTTPPDAFPTLPSLWVVAQAMRDDLLDWMPDYLAAGDRQSSGRQAGQTPKLRSAEVRHGGFWRPEEQTPAAVVWPEGATDFVIDTDGDITATVQLGMSFFASAAGKDATGDVLHRYVSAAIGLFSRFRTLRENASGLALTDMDFTPIAVVRDRTVMGAELSWEATGVRIANRDAGPPPDSDPRPDPTPPWPLPPTAATADVTVDPLSILDPED